MANKLNRLRSLSTGEVFARIGEAARTVAERMGDRPETVLRAEFGDMQDSDAPLPMLRVPSLIGSRRTIELWNERFPQSAARELSIARGIAGGMIPVFSDVIDFRGGIDWHLDPKTGRRAPMRFYRDIDTLDSAVVGDVKNIWEINRCNFLVTLGRAYGASGRKEFYGVWRDTVSSWIEANPYNNGVNWGSSLELAVRAVNWLWSASLFRDELERDAVMRGRLIRSLYLHGRHIYRHLSYYFSPNTHLTGEALGLLYIGSAYPGLSDSAGWMETAENVLEAELRRQILPDGGYFEMTTWYHKYTIDFYLNYLLLSSRPGEETREILRRSVRHLALLAGPDGNIPLLGDADGGRLLFLSPSKTDLRGACCAAAAMLQDGELKFLCGGGFEEEALWLLGADGAEMFEGLPQAVPDRLHSINESTGLYCFRAGRGRDASALIVDCGQLGWKNCGHAHSDLLSFVLYCRGEPVIVDPGTLTYSGDGGARDESRVSQRHNTISINGTSQSEPGGLFDWRTRAHPQGVRCFAGGNTGFFAGTGLLENTPEGRITRIIHFLGGRLIVISDFIVVRDKTFSYLSNLQFGPGRLERMGKGFFGFHGDQARHFVRLLPPAGSVSKMLGSEIYPDYGLAVEAPMLRTTQSGSAGTAAMTTVFGADRDLVEGFTLGGGGSIASSAEGAQACIHADIGGPSEDDIGSSAVLAYGDSMMATISNCRSARDASGMPVFETDRRHAFVTAVIEGETASLYSPFALTSLRFSRPVGKIFLNGDHAPFDLDDGWMVLGRAAEGEER